MAGKPGTGGNTRNPEKYCTAMKSDRSGPCEAYRVVGSDKCSAHGAASPAAREARAKATIVEMAGMFDLPVPVSPEDYAEIGGQYVGMQNQIVTALLADLRERTQGMSAVEITRDYKDILDAINMSQREAGRMMEKTGELRARNPKPAPASVAPPLEKMAELLNGTRERLLAGLEFTCANCGHTGREAPGAFSRRIAESSEEGEAEPSAQILPYRPDFI